LLLTLAGSAAHFAESAGGFAESALKCDESMKSDFTAKVLAAVRRIPRGRVATYGDVAALAGKPRAARAVGNIMKDCGRADVPCHRVIAAGGRLGGYGGNEVLKRALLVAEGVPIHGARVKMRDCRITRLQEAQTPAERRRTKNRKSASKTGHQS